jgi:hypothetical protein
MPLMREAVIKCSEHCGYFLRFMILPCNVSGYDFHEKDDIERVGVRTEHIVSFTGAADIL